jgi:hypothetical protein
MGRPLWSVEDSRPRREQVLLAGDAPRRHPVCQGLRDVRPDKANPS